MPGWATGMGHRFGGMPLPIRTVQVSRRDRAALEALIRTRTAAQRVVERAKIVLAASAGLSGNSICQRLGVSRPTVLLWLNRYEAEGLDGLLIDRPRGGRPKRISPALEAEIVHTTLHSPPPRGTHWSTRLMAAETGLLDDLGDRAAKGGPKPSGPRSGRQPPSGPSVAC